MTISQLITELQKLQVLHGDLSVTRTDWDEYGYRIYPPMEEVEIRDGKDRTEGEGQHCNIE